MNTQDLGDEIRGYIGGTVINDEHGALSEVVGRLRVYFSALRSGDTDLAQYELSYLQAVVEPDRIESAPVVRQRWWHPLSTRICMLLVGLAAIGLSASVTAVAMRLRAQDAEVQLRTCQAK